MQPPSRGSEIVSKTFFVSQLIAISLVGLTAALADLLANDLLSALVLLAGILAMIVLVWFFRLPKAFARRLSPGMLSAGAILYSVFAVAFAYIGAAGYTDRPEAILARPVVQVLRAGSLVAFAAFALALLANVIAAVLARRATQRPAQG